MTAALVRGNALALPLADATVDLIVTSPPYFGLRSYQDGGEHYAGQIGSEATPREFVDALVVATAEMARALKPTGSIWVNLGDKYSGAQAQNFGGTSRAGHAAKVWAQTNPKNTGIPNKSLMGMPWRYALRCIDDLGLVLRSEVIWAKPNGLPESVRDRVRRSHETWFHFVKQDRYYSAVDELRTVPLRVGPRSGARDYTLGPLVPGKSGGQTGLADRPNHPSGTLPGSVWEIPTQPLQVPPSLGIDHFAAFPMEWPRRIIRAWCPPDGIVLDPFGGTGTTALVADALGRRGVSLDMSGDYCRLARWRTTDPGERARALQVEKPPSTDHATADLLELPAGGAS